MTGRDGVFPEDFLNKAVTRRQLIQGAAAIAAGAALSPVFAACGSGGSSPSPSGTARKTGGHLKVATAAGSAKETLDIHGPPLTIPASAMRLNLYDSLLEFGPQGALGMALAEELVPNKTATQFTVRLKSGLVFHNGQPVTADDVVASFNRILDPKNPGVAAQQLVGLSRNGVRKVDNLTVRFELDAANAAFPQALAEYPAGIVPLGYDPKGAEGAIGTGPFKIESFLPGQRAELVKNADYWRDGPYTDKLSLIEFADPTAQLNALLGRAVEYCQMIPGGQRKVAETAGFALLEAKSGSWAPFTMRADVKPFNDMRVRQAFRLIVNRPQTIAQAADGLQWLGNDMYAPYDPGYPKDLAQRVQDLEQAKSLLKAAGYDNDLVVELNTSNAVSAGAPAAATVFAEQAKGGWRDRKGHH